MRTPSPPPKRFQYWMVPGSSGVLARPAPTGEEHPASAAAPTPASAPRKRVRREMGPFMCAVLHLGTGRVTARWRVGSRPGRDAEAQFRLDLVAVGRDVAGYPAWFRPSRP